MTPSRNAPVVYGGQIMCGPCQSSSYIEAYGSGVSNGSCGSNSSTNSRNGARAGEVALVAKVAARVVVGHVTAAEARGTEPARVGPSLPGVALVPALVVPGAEVAVVVLAPGLEQVGVIADELGGDASGAQRHGQRVLPQLDRPPRLPQEIERATEQIVPGRHARQRAGVVLGEAHGTGRERVEVRRVELARAVGAEQVAVQAVQQDHHGPRGPARRRV